MSREEMKLEILLFKMPKTGSGAQKQFIKIHFG
jgi:hypothetical protein